MVKGRGMSALIGAGELCTCGGSVWRGVSRQQSPLWSHSGCGPEPCYVLADTCPSPVHL